jgi:redox-sensitive bicupin YhaK (pirin superfamily)
MIIGLLNLTKANIQIMHFLRKSQDRGYADHGWLKSFHSFSFAGYHDPKFMGWGNLRVINEDRVAPGMGFGKHGHRNMEIISYVLSGELAHQDSMGNDRVLLPGQIQLMSAGTGVMHSERNPQKDQTTHMLQIWIVPNRRNLPPSYTEWHPKPESDQESKVLVISPDGRDGSATIHQDAFIYRLKLTSGAEIAHSLSVGRGGWIQLMRGSLTVNERSMTAGDGLSTKEASMLTIKATSDAEALLFDLK